MARYGGNGWFIDFTGLNRLLRAFDEWEQRARALRGKDWIVGSVAEHSRHVEWGDRYRPGKHILERALNTVAATIQGDPSMRARLAKGLFIDDDGLIPVVAKMIREECERLTVAEDAVDTGELRDSWRARPA